MTDPKKSFMEQFARARNEFQQMPQWMKDSAKVATLTYPVSKAPGTNRTPPTPDKKR